MTMFLSFSRHYTKQNYSNFTANQRNIYLPGQVTKPGRNSKSVIEEQVFLQLLPHNIRL